MANEATVNCSLTIIVGNINYSSRPSGFKTSVAGQIGPTPGAVTVSTAGTDISLAALTTPGLCRVMNIDPTNYVEYGIYNGANFYPLGRLLPGDTFVIRLSPNINGGGATFRFKANTANAVVVVEAFQA